MYDRQTESLWSQLQQEAITGPLTGAKLKILPSQLSKWEYWRTRHPDTLVLSPNLGFNRDYGLNPYAEYWELGAPPPGRSTSNRQKPKVKLSPLERVLGVQIDGVRKAYPFSILKKMDERIEDYIEGRKIIVNFDKKTQTGYITDENGKALPSITLFWFAWYDFYPDTLVLELVKKP